MNVNIDINICGIDKKNKHNSINIHGLKFKNLF